MSTEPTLPGHTRTIHFLQDRILAWFEKCFGAAATRKKKTRLYAFFEEACELIQAGDLTEEEGHAMLRHVFARPKGELSQEIAGAFNTLAMVANSHEIDMEAAVEKEIDRIWRNIPLIQAKQAQKLRPVE